MKVKKLIQTLHAIVHHSQRRLELAHVMQEPDPESGLSGGNGHTGAEHSKALSDVMDAVIQTPEMIDNEVHARMSFTLMDAKSDMHIVPGTSMGQGAYRCVLRQCVYCALYTQVWLAWHPASAAMVAVKIKYAGPNVYEDAMFERELRIHRSIGCSHDHIVSALGVIREKNRVCLVMSYDAYVDVRTYMARRGVSTLSVRRAQYIASRVLSALAHLHDRSICHRDVKPSNVLVNGRGDVKLCDFGVSIDLREEIAVTRCGTALYMAPEVKVCPLKHQLPEQQQDEMEDFAYSTSVDVWSLGAMTFELLFGIDALRHLTQSDHIEDILDALSRLEKVASSQHLLRAVSFIQACMKSASAHRPPCRQLLRLPFCDATLSSSLISF